MKKIGKICAVCVGVLLILTVCLQVFSGRMTARKNETVRHAEDGVHIEEVLLPAPDDEAKTHLALCETYTFDLNSDCFEGNVSDDEMGDYQIRFKGSIGHPGTLKIGKGNGLTAGMYLLLKESTAEVYTAIDNNMLATYNHRLDLKSFVEVVIAPDLQGKAILRIKTEGGEYVVGQVPWTASEGSVFVASVGKTKWKDCSLTYHCEGWEKDTWLFGDSYFSTTRPDRWTTYVVEAGNHDFMLNGWPGRNSEEALASLKNCLNYGTPKTIVWCLGMNDGPDEEEVNPNWLDAIEELKQICEEKEIELVPATVPNCPPIDNRLKNVIIRESGCRYLDFAAAVGSDEDPNWTEGMIEEGDEPYHPNTGGALALYEKAMTKIPELLTDGAL